MSCPECRAEFLVAFSCRRRGVCPSCVAKRGALFGVFLAEEVVEDVGHRPWTFTLPKMLRPYFQHHRELLGGHCRASWEVVRELMAAAERLFRHQVITLLRDEELLSNRFESAASCQHRGLQRPVRTSSSQTNPLSLWPLPHQIAAVGSIVYS